MVFVAFERYLGLVSNGDIHLRRRSSKDWANNCLAKNALLEFKWRGHMTLETLIGGLSREEQIVAMELLWKRLTTEDPSTAPPEWHRSVVEERVAALERGDDTLSDWADAKKRLADRLR
jgi:hypothetical protein